MQSSIATDSLVDISKIQVNPELPRQARIAAYVHQIHNPYQFRCAGFVVTARYAKQGPSLEDCLRRIAA